MTGAAALLMEWGIVRGNDVELYGEKGKAYLMRGAKPLPGITDYPDVAAGYTDSVWKVACQIKILYLWEKHVI